MRKLLSLSVALLSAATAFGDLPPIVKTYHGDTIPVHVSGNTGQLNALAMKAFGAHGRYELVQASSAKYDFAFTELGGNQVRLDIRQGSQIVASETAVGTDPRNALFRAADIAVEKTNGQGLRGFFTSKLAFLIMQGKNKEVCTSDLFFGNIVQITHDHAIALSPRWSPDGRRILYTSYFQSGFPDIFEIDLNSFQRTTFVSFKGTNMGARFSPDGSRVAMVLTGSGDSQIWVSDASGHHPVRKTAGSEVKSSPCWSPDGSRIVYTSDPGPQLYIMSAGGGGGSRVTHGLSGYCAEPDWSRTKPNLIAFTARTGGYQIAVLDLSSGQSKQVSKAPFDGIEPSWLPDGRHLVYTGRTPSQSALYILDTENQSAVKISPSSLPPVSSANVLALR